MKRREKLAVLEEESRESEAKAEEAERAELALQTQVLCSFASTQFSICRSDSAYYVYRQVTRLENQVLAEEGKHFQLEQEMESFFKDLSDI